MKHLTSLREAGSLTMNVQTIHAVYVKTENRPGSLERVARALADKRINIDAIAAETVGSTGFVRIVTHRSREVVDALRAANVEAYESQFVLASPPNRPGELAKVCAELAAAGINVEAILTTPEGKLAFRTHDNDLAATILGKL